MLPPSARRKLATIGLATLCLVGMAGCHDRTLNGDEATYSFAAWARAAVILVGIALMPLGWHLLHNDRFNGRWGLAFLILGPLLLIFIAPSMFADRVRVSREGFEASYGFWWSPTVVKVRFDDLSRMRHVGERGSRNQVNYKLHCLSKAGQDTELALGDLVRNAVPEIIKRARAKQVPTTFEGP